MSFRITGLAPELFQHLFALSDAELAARGAVRRIADRKPGFPCRISLTDPEPGQEVILTHFEHHAVGDGNVLQLEADEIGTLFEGLIGRDAYMADRLRMQRTSMNSMEQFQAKLQAKQ